MRRWIYFDGFFTITHAEITLKDEKQQKQTKNFFASKYQPGHLIALK